MPTAHAPFAAAAGANRRARHRRTRQARRRSSPLDAPAQAQKSFERSSRAKARPDASRHASDAPAAFAFARFRIPHVAQAARAPYDLPQAHTTPQGAEGQVHQFLPHAETPKLRVRTEATKTPFRYKNATPRGQLSTRGPPKLAPVHPHALSAAAGGQQHTATRRLTGLPQPCPTR